MVNPKQIEEEVSGRPEEEEEEEENDKDNDDEKNESPEGPASSGSQKITDISFWQDLFDQIAADAAGRSWGIVDKIAGSKSMKLEDSAPSPLSQVDSSNSLNALPAQADVSTALKVAKDNPELVSAATAAMGGS